MALEWRLEISPKRPAVRGAGVLAFAALVLASGVSSAQDAGRRAPEAASWPSVISPWAPAFNPVSPSVMAGLKDLTQTSIGPELPAAFTAAITRMNPDSAVDRGLAGALRLPENFAARLASLKEPNLAKRRQALGEIRAEISAAYRQDGRFHDPIARAVDERAKQIRSVVMEAKPEAMSLKERARFFSALGAAARQLEPYVAISPQARSVANFARALADHDLIRGDAAALERAFEDGKSGLSWFGGAQENASAALEAQTGGAALPRARLKPFASKISMLPDKAPAVRIFGEAKIIPLQIKTAAPQIMDIPTMREVEFGYGLTGASHGFQGRLYQAEGVLRVRNVPEYRYGFLGRAVYVHLEKKKAAVLLMSKVFSDEASADDFIRAHFAAYEDKPVDVAFMIRGSAPGFVDRTGPFLIRGIALQPKGWARLPRIAAKAYAGAAKKIPKGILIAAAIVGVLLLGGWFVVVFGSILRQFFAQFLMGLPFNPF